ncbi:MAG TPA: AmmeMemoRadiSam system protein B [Planctomycetota bacterium]|nr:AmmeMemoRadiSam system protein B [Planctomycetota bacterium]
MRPPAVAGSFYPAEAQELRRAVAEALGSPPPARERVLAAIVPHAGYAYSGRVAGAVYARIEIPREVVLLAFNHRGRGKPFALWPEGAWRTPLGDVPVDGRLSRALREAFLPAEFDEAGHAGEHSAEVQLPFLQVLRPDVRIVPVALTVGLEDRSFLQLAAFGRALARVPGDFLVVASTDLNHYEDQETTLRKDAAAIRALERLDAEELRRVIVREEVSMCGFAPAFAVAAYARARGAAAARTIVHATSGDVSGDFARVVGYAGLIVPFGK